MELDRCLSASVNVNQGPMISMHAKASMGAQCARTVLTNPPWRIAKGNRSSAPSAHRVNTTMAGERSSTATLISR
nr:hypothetical protein [Streptomyces griseoruber]